jgi:carboxyl-terminal processing protease
LAPRIETPKSLARFERGTARTVLLIFLGTPIGVVAVTLLLTQRHTLLMGSAAGAAVSDTYREFDLFGDVFERVRADYVEKPEDSKFVESAISGMLAGLDPHSGYMNPHTFRDMQVQTRDELGGLGIEDAHSLAASR